MKTLFWILCIIFLALLITIIVLLSLRISENYGNIDPIVAKLYANLAKIDPKCAKKITIKKAGKSYTVNKKHVHLCVKDEETGEYFNNNMLMYVLLHEIAHVLSKSVGHTKEFHRKFDELLKKAEHLGYYDPNIPPVENYIEKCIV